MKKSNGDKAMCNCTLAFLSKNDVQFFPSIFSPFWGENFLVELERKHLGQRPGGKKKKKKNEAEQRRQADFCPKMISNFSLQVSLHFGEKTFWWA